MYVYAIHKLKQVTHRKKKYGKSQLSIIQKICVEQEIQRKKLNIKQRTAYTEILSCCFQLILTFAQGARCFQRTVVEMLKQRDNKSSHSTDDKVKISSQNA